MVTMYLHVAEFKELLLELIIDLTCFTGNLLNSLQYITDTPSLLITIMYSLLSH